MSFMYYNVKVQNYYKNDCTRRKSVLHIRYFYMNAFDIIVLFRFKFRFFINTY